MRSALAFVRLATSASPQGFPDEQCLNIGFVTSHRTITSPLLQLDSCAKMILLQSSMLRGSTTAIPTGWFPDDRADREPQEHQ
jgi:hypothetical protein